MSIKQEYKTIFSVPYTSGFLKAVGVENDKEMESTILKTVSAATKIQLTADRDEIRADGQDLSFVTVEITDKDGNVQPNAENQLLFHVEGPGAIAGVGNANLKDLDPYVGNRRRAWHGRALVVLKSTRENGDLSLKVSAPDLEPALLKIKCVKP